MSFKKCVCFSTAALLLCAQLIKTQDGAGSSETSAIPDVIQMPRTAIERFANETGVENLWILLPENFSESQLEAANFSLFKLNTGQLGMEPAGESRDWVGVQSQAGPATSQSAASEPQTRAPIFREGRKMGLFGNVLNKPKVSPLYLVNGTVCRFVNSQPICTTLSTTGLFRGQVPIQNSGGTFGGLFPQQQQQQQQQNFNNNPQLNQRQLSPGQGQGFNNQQNSFQPFRPAALVADESADLNVESANSSSGGTTTQNKPRPSKQQLVNIVQTTRPLNFVANRRPLNLLSFARPFRGHYQRRGKGLSSESAGTPGLHSSDS